MSSMNDDELIPDQIPGDHCPSRPSTCASDFHEICAECRLHDWTDEQRADFVLWLVARQARREGLAFPEGEA
jgi:hypothetical protein